MNWRFWERGKIEAAGRNSPSGNAENGFIRFGGLLDGDFDRATRNGAVTACVHRITSRASQASFTCEDSATQSLLDDPAWIKGQSATDFWREAWETYLYSGNCLLVQSNDGRLRIASGFDASRVFSKTGGGEDGWQVHLVKQNKTTTESVIVMDSKVAVCRWSPAYRQVTKNTTHWLSPSPISVIPSEMNAYTYLYDQLAEFGKRANRVGDIIRQVESIADADEVEAKRAEYRKMLSKRRNFQASAVDIGFEFTRLPTQESPSLENDVATALAGVARVYGVPLQFLQSSPTLVAQEFEEAEARLIRDAVAPMLDVFAAALSKLLMKPVMANYDEVGNPTRRGTGEMIATLARTGAFTINELREYAGRDPIPDGDKLPETVGGVERNQNGQNPTGGDNKKDGGKSSKESMK